MERQRQRVDAAVGCVPASIDALEKSAKSKSGAVSWPHRRSAGADQQPFALAEQPLLRRLRDVAGIEARLAGCKLDGELLPVLLLGNLLGPDLDAGQCRELRLELLQDVVEGAFLQRDLDLLALEALPVEAALRPRGMPNSVPAVDAPAAPSVDCSSARRSARGSVIDAHVRSSSC